MEYNIVTNYRIIQEAKRYPHYTVSLGFSATLADPKDATRRNYNEKDKFALFYNKRYKTTIYGQGYIGDISFYTDHYIKDDVVAIYYNFEEFIFNFDIQMCQLKGIEWYLGSLFKQIDEQRERKKNEEIAQTETPVGNPYKLVPGHPQYNPGSVTFDDIKAYNEAKRLGKL